jgi:uncharacterized protein
MPSSLISGLLGEKIKIDWKIATITVISTLLILINYYYTLTPGYYFDSVLLFILTPLGITILGFGERPKDYGFTLGDWKAGLWITTLGIVLMAPVIWLLAKHSAAMQGYYSFSQEGLIWKKALELFGWEYLFRGWLLFGYAQKYGSDALWIQAVPFAIAHQGKPSIETLSTIFGGFAFGWVAWRTGSFLYPFLIHWFISALIVIISSSGLG